MKKKTAKKENFFYKNYKLCWKFLKETKNYIWFSVFLFFLFAVIGFIFPTFFKQQIFDYILGITLKLKDYSAIQLIGFIFFNNLKASFFAIVLGIALGVIPIIFTVTNGYLLGFVARYSVSENGFLVLWRILPHGIFELPAVLMSIGIGLKLGASFFKKNKKKTFKSKFIESIRFFVFVIFPLLLIAAIIEGILVFYLK